MFSSLLVPLSLLVVQSSSFDSQQLRYDLLEENAEGTSVADIKKDAHLAAKYNQSALDNLRFVFLGDSQYFILDPFSGMITRSSIRLDREKICSGFVDCILEVDVAIQPPYFQIIKLSIQVLDVNDNAPRFPMNSMNITVPEDTPPGVISSVPLARDPDSPQNGVDRYSLRSDSDKFDLEVQKDLDGTIYSVSLLLRDALDREEKDAYVVKVVASDGGSPSKSGTFLLNISVADINDNRPEFEKTLYEIKVKENSVIKKSLLTIHARDLDSGLNGKIEFRFSDKTRSLYGHLFRIDADTGQLELVQSLDYEQNSRIVLEVMAKDRGQPETFPATARIIVEVIDENDNAPEVDLDVTNGEGGTIRVKENSPNNTFVLQMSVKDADVAVENGSIVYCALEQRNHMEPKFQLIRIVQNEYRIATIGEIDREMNDLYRLAIVCKDAGNPQQTTTKELEVLIDDVNDNVPVFTQPIYNVNITENNSPKEAFLIVSAIDKDIGDNGRVTYGLQTDTEDLGLFEVNRTSGSIWSTKLLDYESKKLFRILIIAKDNSPDENHFSTAEVIINVIDANDEAPKFPQPRYDFTVEENQSGKTVVGQVTAFDKDSSPHNQHSYYLDATMPNAPIGFFKIDPKTGVISTKRSLNREDKAIYQMSVIARDEELLTLKDVVEVLVKVTDQNDNAPVIRFPSIGNDSVHISSSASVGSRIATLVADDLDEGENSRLVFSISEGNDLNIFQIDSQTGDITVHSKLDEYEHRTIRLLVAVEDSGQEKKMRSLSSLRVIVGSKDSQSRILVTAHDSSGLDAHLLIIVTFVCGAIFIASIFIFIVCFVCRRRRRRKKRVIDNEPALMIHPSAVCDKYRRNPTPSAICDSNLDITDLTEKSWKRDSIIVEELENVDGYVVINHSLEANEAMSSPAMTIERRSRLCSTNSDVIVRCPCSESHVVGQVYIPQMPDYGACCKYISYRPLYSNSDLGLHDSSVMTCPSPDWKYSINNPSHQRRPSFSRWLNSESFQLQQKGQAYNVTDNNTSYNSSGRSRITLPPQIRPATEPPRPLFDGDLMKPLMTGKPSPSPSFYNRLYSLGEKQDILMKHSPSNQLIAGSNGTTPISFNQG